MFNEISEKDETNVIDNPIYVEISQKEITNLKERKQIEDADKLLIAELCLNEEIKEAVYKIKSLRKFANQLERNMK